MTEQVIDQQVDRLDFLPDFATSRLALKEAIWRAADSEQHLVAIVDVIKDRWSEIPSREQVETIAATIPAMQLASASRLGCTKCNGSGWVNRTVIIETGVYAGLPASYADRCACMKPALAAAEAKTQPKPPAKSPGKSGGKTPGRKL